MLVLHQKHMGHFFTHTPFGPLYAPEYAPYIYIRFFVTFFAYAPGYAPAKFAPYSILSFHIKLLFPGPSGFRKKIDMRRVCDGQLSLWLCDVAPGRAISTIRSCYNSIAPKLTPTPRIKRIAKLVQKDTLICAGYATRPKLLLFLAQAASNTKWLCARYATGSLRPSPAI